MTEKKDELAIGMILPDGYVYGGVSPETGNHLRTRFPLAEVYEEFDPTTRQAIRRPDGSISMSSPARVGDAPRAPHKPKTPGR